MTGGQIYPADLDGKTPVTPEIKKLWEDAMRAAKSQRNWDVLKIISLIFLAHPGSFLIAAFIHPWVGIAVFGSVIVTPVILNYLMIHTFEYTVSEDRKSARIEFKRIYQTLPAALKKSAGKARESASKDLDGCMRTVTIGFIGVMLFPFLSLCYLPVFLNRVIWLSDYKYLLSKWVPQSDGTEKRIVRGTKIQPSVAPAGSAPDSGDEDELFAEDSILRVFDDKLELFPDGKVACKGGVNFGAQAKIEGMTINGMTLTRTDRGLLRVHYEGADHAFFYNGSTWAKV